MRLQWIIEPPPPGFQEPKIKRPEDIAGLPWRGNWAADSWLHDRVSAYCEALEEGSSEQIMAGILSSHYGMGIGFEEIAEYDSLSELNRARLEKLRR